MTVTESGTSKDYTLTGANITDGTTTLGTIDSTTGKILGLKELHFINNTQVEVEYVPKFFSFSLQTSKTGGMLLKTF